MKQILLAFLVLGSASCSHELPQKAWHPKSYNPAGIDMAFSTDKETEGQAVVDYLGPAMIPFSKVKTVRIGDRGEDVYAITKDYFPQYPAYWQHGSLIMTEIDGCQYAVAYLLDEQSGVITDISYQKLTL
jgi:hypothetical protein